MESSIILGISSSIGFAVYYEMQGATYVNHINPTSISLSIEWLNFPGFMSWQLVTGFCIGVVSAGLCFVTLIMSGVCKQIFIRMREKLGGNSYLKEVIPPVIGGIVIGKSQEALV